MKKKKQSKQKKPVKVKKKRKKQPNRKALTTWSSAVRARDNHTCIVCGNPKYLNAHHILQKSRYPEYKLEVDNGVSLCAGCHNFKRLSAHQNAIWFSEWLKANRPELFQIALSRINAAIPITEGKQ